MALARIALRLCAWAERWAPLRFHGTTMAPAGLLSAKLLVAYFLIGEWDLAGQVFLPLWTGLNHIPLSAETLRFVAWWSFHGFAALLIFNRVPRLASCVTGFLLVWGLVASRLEYSNSRLCFGLFLLLLGLGAGSKRTPEILRIQFVLIYGGAALNKLLDPAWRNGVALDFYCDRVLELAHWRWITQVVPVPLLGWLVIAIEAVLAIGFLRKQWVGRTIWLGLVFHVGMLVFTLGELSWMFLYVVATGYLAVAPGLVRAPVDVPSSTAGRRDSWRRVTATPHLYVGIAAIFWVAKYLKWHVLTEY